MPKNDNTYARSYADKGFKIRLQYLLYRDEKKCVRHERYHSSIGGDLWKLKQSISQSEKIRESDNNYIIFTHSFS